MSKRLLPFFFIIAAAAMACDSDEPTPVAPTRPSSTASDFTPAVSGRAVSESFQIDFAVSALPSSEPATSESFQLQLGGNQ